MTILLYNLSIVNINTINWRSFDKNVALKGICFGMIVQTHDNQKHTPVGQNTVGPW